MMADMIRVVALRNGFCVGRRKKDEKFFVPVGTTASWFVPVEKKGPPDVAPPEPKTLTLPPKGGKLKGGADALI
jgi:hypothetical protein